MPQPAAKQGDRVIGMCSHLVQPPPPASPVLVSGHPFSGVLTGGLSPNVLIQGLPAATVGSEAINSPPHVPIGGTFVNLALVTNRATITTGSPTVLINGRQAARNADQAHTCDELQSPGQVAAAGTVLVGP